MATEVLLKRFEATFIESACETYEGLIASDSETLGGVASQVSGLSRAQTLSFHDPEAAALIEMLVLIEAGEETDSEAERQIAREILNRIELPDGFDDPYHFAEIIVTAPPEPDPMEFEPEGVDEIRAAENLGVEQFRREKRRGHI